MTTLAANPLANEFTWLIEAAHAPALRGIRQWAESEIVIPTGDYAGEKFRASTQPFAAPILDAMDSGQWASFALLGCVQSGKSLLGWDMPICYHLFEVEEDVVAGLPDMRMAETKWRSDLLPIIERTRYAKYLPTVGAGSKRGAIKDAIRFTNGAVLKFAGGGGTDAQRSGFTAAVSAITEAEKLDLMGGSSKEADKIKQIRARASARGDRARHYTECTVTVSQGIMWREYEAGSMGSFVCPCPQCGAWVNPERSDFKGWQGAEDVMTAREGAYFECPACKHHLTIAERFTMNHRLKMIFRGQEVSPEGEIVGSLPRTRDFSARWSAFNNLFWEPPYLGEQEWKARREPDEESAERSMCQHHWALPYSSPTLEVSRVDYGAIVRRANPEQPRGIVPEDCQTLSVGVDLGKHWTHWVVLACAGDASPRVVDYGAVEVKVNELGLEAATAAALREVEEFSRAGWPAKAAGPHVIPRLVLVDSGWGETTETVYEFCRQASNLFRPAKGIGGSRYGNVRYQRPRATGPTVIRIGDGYHVVRLRAHRVMLFDVDADHWKSWLHERLRTPPGQPGAFALFAGGPDVHGSYARHLAAEELLEEYVAGKGMVRTWDNTRHRPNHYLDATCLACVAAHALGARVGGDREVARPQAPRIARKSLGSALGGDRPFLVSQR